jgi:catechol 2,3-dioxygenase-like lactoylglutathione lyase family enzyme
MKRFHVHVGVKNLEESVRFYSALFGHEPAKRKDDYAKWVLEDPRICFAVSTRSRTEGVDHVGFQVDEDKELSELTDRLRKANLKVFGEGETTCCYARSQKAWVQDPGGLAWEAYRTMADAEVFSEKPKVKLGEACCAPTPSPNKPGCC